MQTSNAIAITSMTAQFKRLRLPHRIIDDRMENSIKGRRIGDNLR